MATCDQSERRLTRCSLCSETFDVPKFLPCLHSFCENCLQVYINKTFVVIDGNQLNKDQDSPYGIHCPLCQTFVSKPQGTDSKVWAKLFPKNYLFHHLLAEKNTETENEKCSVSQTKNENETDFHQYSGDSTTLCQSCRPEDGKSNSAGANEVNGAEHRALTAGMTCQEHLKYFEYFCSDHSVICCASCVVLKHRQCEHVITAEEAAKTRREEDDEATFRTSICDLKDTCKTIMIRRDQNAKDLTSKLDTTKQIVQKSYDDMMCYLEKAKSNSLDEIVDCEKQYLPQIKTEKADMECKMINLDNVLDLLDMASLHASPVHYLYMREMLTTQKDAIEKYIAERKCAIENIDIHFTPDENLPEIMKAIEHLGRISVFKTKPEQEDTSSEGAVMQSAQVASAIIATQLTGQVKDISNRMVSVTSRLLKEINTDGNVTGAAILDDGRIMASKHGTTSIILVGREGNQMSSIPLESHPWGIRMISPKRGAVVVENKSLQFFKVTPTSIVKSISFVIPSKNDFIFHKNVYYIGRSKRIQVFNDSLSHVRDITVPHIVGYMAVRNDSSLCYTVYMGHELYCINMDGTSEFTYSHDKLKSTTGVAVDHTGSIYVCGYTSMNVHKLSHDGKLQTIILDNLPAFPYCISFSSQGDKAIVGCNCKILLFNIL